LWSCFLKINLTQISEPPCADDADDEDEGLPLVMADLRARLYDAAQQVHGFKCILDVTGTDANRTALVANGACAVVLQAMAAHPKVAPVQQYGATVLGFLCIGLSGRGHVANQTAIGSLLSHFLRIRIFLDTGVPMALTKRAQSFCRPSSS
jgi:hypothetical protein